MINKSASSFCYLLFIHLFSTSTGSHLPKLPPWLCPKATQSTPTVLCQLAVSSPLSPRHISRAPRVVVSTAICLTIVDAGGCPGPLSISSATPVRPPFLFPGSPQWPPHDSSPLRPASLSSQSSALPGHLAFYISPSETQAVCLPASSHAQRLLPADQLAISWKGAPFQLRRFPMFLSLSVHAPESHLS